MKTPEQSAARAEEIRQAREEQGYREMTYRFDDLLLKLKSQRDEAGRSEAARVLSISITHLEDSHLRYKSLWVERRL